jgi:hypothetical protein
MPLFMVGLEKVCPEYTSPSRTPKTRRAAPNKKLMKQKGSPQVFLPQEEGEEKTG